MRGTGFKPGATVKVGGLNAQVISISANEIRVKTPDLPQGYVGVEVMNPDQQSAQLPSPALHVSWVTTVSTSGSHTCAALNQEIQCWGLNTNGQLGNGINQYNPGQYYGPPIIQNTPVKVVGISGNITALSTGLSHTCAIVNGGAKCWGSNGNGQLGNNPKNFIDLSTPVNVLGLEAGVTSISAGDHRTCAVANARGYCWGNGSGNGALGLGSVDFQYYPAQMLHFESAVTALKTSLGSITCGIKAGALFCWGTNQQGGLGDGTTITISTPFDVPGTITSNVPILVPTLSSGVTDLYMGTNNICVRVNNEIRCWGMNSLYQLANSHDLETYIPQVATALPSLPTMIAMNSVASCGIFAGAAKCWGRILVNSNDDTMIAQTPVDVSGLGSGVQYIASGSATTCATKNGGLYCWGYGAYGALGNGSNANAFEPVVPDLIW